MPSDAQMRKAIKEGMYRNRESWEAKVDKMPPKQVAAVYARLLDNQKK